MMSTYLPDAETVRTALALAVRAPSVHNSQPWRFRVGPRSLHLYANFDLHLRETDPDRRDLMLSCGIALNHLAVALAALGWQSKIHRFPNPSEPQHLAAIELTPYTPGEVDIALAAAIPRRRTDRRHFSSWPVATGDIALMASRAARAGVKLLMIEDVTEFNKVAKQAIRRHITDDAYLRELTQWSGRHASLAGVPARNAPASDSTANLPGRVFAGTALAQPSGVSAADDCAVVLALGTRDDDDLARLRAGEATSLVLLTATALGLSSCPITEPLEIVQTRTRVRTTIFDSREYPQMILRVGWAPANAEPLPATPRRPLGDVVTALDGSSFEA